MNAALRGIAVALLALFSGNPPARQANGSPGQQVRALAEAGRLTEAEQLARGGGAALTVPLGEVLLLRGKLTAADSAFTSAVRGNLPGHRSAEAGLAELAARRGETGVMPHTAGFFKSPLAGGTHDFPLQMARLSEYAARARARA